MSERVFASSEFPNPESLLAADCVQLEYELDIRTRQLVIYRTMMQEALAIAHAAIAELARRES